MSEAVGSTIKIEQASRGVELDPQGELLIDSACPRAIPIRAYNPLTREFKHYMLRVTSKGGLCLV